MVPGVSPLQAAELRAAGATLVDVRRADEVARERIPGAVHIPLDTLSGRASELPSDPLVMVCQTGDRSAFAAQALIAAGREAYSLRGGVPGWAEAGLPTEIA